MGPYGTTKNAERVAIVLCSGRTVREKRGTIISNQFLYPTTYPTTFLVNQKRSIL